MLSKSVKSTGSYTNSAFTLYVLAPQKGNDQGLRSAHRTFRLAEFEAVTVITVPPR